MKVKCPNCKLNVQFRFRFDIPPKDYREYYPNECPVCGCFANYTGAWLPRKGKKKLNFWTRLLLRRTDVTK